MNTETYTDKILNSRTLPVIFFITVLALPSLGFCDSAEMEAASASFVKTALATWLKRILVTIFAVLGIVRAAAAQSGMPILLWGGIASILAFIEKLINFFVTLTL